MYNTTEDEMIRAERAIRSSAHHEAREIVTHYESVTVGIKIPLAMSFITSALLSVLVVIACHYLEFGKWYQVFGISFMVILTLDWLRRSEAWRRRVYDLEQLLHLDLDRDNYIGVPEPEPEPIRETVEIVISHADSGRRQWLEFPVSRAKLAEMASDLCSGAAFTEASMSGAGAIYSRREYNEIRDTLIKRELMQWKSPDHRNMGVELTDAGWRVMRALAAEHRAVHPSEIPIPHYEDA